MTQATFATHEVLNQSPPFEDVDLFALDRPLVDAVAANGGASAAKELSEFGKHWGSAAMAARGRAANENTPKLRTFDSRGNRRDEVEFHPAYHELMAQSAHAGVHNSTWTAQGKPAGGAAEVVRAAKFYIAAQVETGHLCPITMTRASVAALAAQPELLAKTMPVIATRAYDPGFAPWWTKRGMTLGMGMTEKQGGTDVRSNLTRAERDGDAYLITGHKWFMSAPMCDAFLVLAQADEGLSCFFMPRFAPDGSVNAIRFQRLKDKLGNRSNASAEIELHGAWAVMVGEEGRGVRTIIDMVNITRLDCVIGSASLMRQAVAQATHHTAHRSAFGHLLSEQPLMVNVLADLAVESEATTVLMMRLAGAVDRATEPREAAFKRLALAVAKYWTTKRSIAVVAEALECHGGNGYVEESIMPRLYREAPLNSIWEGSGNVNALDVLRAMKREPQSVLAYLDELDEVRGMDPRLDDAVRNLKKLLSDGDDAEARARTVVELMAVALQAALLVRYGDPYVADAFCASRLDSGGGRSFGTLQPSSHLPGIVERHRPAI